MSDGGKGSKPRPLSVSQREYENRWDAIFGRDNVEDNSGVQKNEYYDIISTEDALLEDEAFKEIERRNSKGPSGGMVDTADLKSAA
jgi:hypothetical protein